MAQRVWIYDITTQSKVSRLLNRQLQDILKAFGERSEGNKSELISRVNGLFLRKIQECREGKCTDAEVERLFLMVDPTRQVVPTNNANTTTVTNNSNSRSTPFPNASVQSYAMTPSGGLQMTISVPTNQVHDWLHAPNSNSAPQGHSQTRGALPPLNVPMQPPLRVPPKINPAPTNAPSFVQQGRPQIMLRVGGHQNQPPPHSAPPDSHVEPQPQPVVRFNTASLHNPKVPAPMSSVSTHHVDVNSRGYAPSQINRTPINPSSNHSINANPNWNRLPSHNPVPQPSPHPPVIVPSRQPGRLPAQSHSSATSNNTNSVTPPSLVAPTPSLPAPIAPHPTSSLHPQADFRDPFYEVVKTYCQFPIKPPRFGSSSIEGLYTLVLSYPDYNHIRTEGLSIQLQCSITKSQDVNATKVHRWPVGSVLRVNNQVVELTQRDEKKKTHSLPAIITPQMAVGSNSIRLVASSLMPHVAQVVSAKRIPIDKIVEMMVQKHQMEYNESRKKVLASFKAHSADIMATHSKVSILDPLMRIRISVPARAHTCKHIECFELSTYLTMNEKIRKWICPVCNKPADYYDLYVDGYFMSILNEIPKSLSISDVTVHPDASWQIITEEEEEAKRKEEYEKMERAIGLTGGSTQTKQKKNVEIIALSDSDDEMKMDEESSAEEVESSEKEREQSDGSNLDLEVSAIALALSNGRAGSDSPDVLDAIIDDVVSPEVSRTAVDILPPKKAIALTFRNLNNAKSNNISNVASSNNSRPTGAPNFPSVASKGDNVVSNAIGNFVGGSSPRGSQSQKSSVTLNDLSDYERFILCKIIYLFHLWVLDRDLGVMAVEDKRNANSIEDELDSIRDRTNSFLARAASDSSSGSMPSARWHPSISAAPPTSLSQVVSNSNITNHNSIPSMPKSISHTKFPYTAPTKPAPIKTDNPNSLLQSKGNTAQTAICLDSSEDEPESNFPTQPSQGNNTRNSNAASNNNSNSNNNSKNIPKAQASLSAYMPVMSNSNSNGSSNNSNQNGRFIPDDSPSTSPLRLPDDIDIGETVRPTNTNNNHNGDETNNNSNSGVNFDARAASSDDEVLYLPSTPESQKIARRRARNPPDERVRNSSSVSSYTEVSDDGDESGVDFSESDEEESDRDFLNGPLEDLVPAKRATRAKQSKKPLNVKLRARREATEESTSSQEQGGWGDRSEEELDYEYSRPTNEKQREKTTISNYNSNKNNTNNNNIYEKKRAAPSSSSESSEGDEAKRTKYSKVNQILSKYGSVNSNGTLLNRSKLAARINSQSQSDNESGSQPTKRKALSELASPASKVPKTTNDPNDRT